MSKVLINVTNLSTEYSEDNIKSIKDLKKFYSECKYGTVIDGKVYTGKDYNRNIKDKEYTLTIQQQLQYKCGICYDTVGMSWYFLSKWNISFKAYFLTTRKEYDKQQGIWGAPTHTVLIYKENNVWKWLEGSWGPHLNNRLSNVNPDVLIKDIGKIGSDFANHATCYVRELKTYPELGKSIHETYKEFMQSKITMIINDFSVESLDKYSQEAIESMEDNWYNKQGNVKMLNNISNESVSTETLTLRKYNNSKYDHDLLAVAIALASNACSHRADYRELIPEVQDKVDYLVAHSGYNDIFFVMNGKTEVGSFRIENKFNPVEICDVAIFEEYQNKGYGQQMIRLAINYSLEHYPDKGIRIDSEKTNPRATHVYEKMGFRIEDDNPNDPNQYMLLYVASKESLSYSIEAIPPQYSNLVFENNPNKVKIYKTYKPYYTDYGSHGYNHIEEVLATAYVLKGKTDLTDKEYAAILIHDIGRKYENEKEGKFHNILSAEIARKTLPKLNIFTNDELEEIYKAVLYHRKTWRKEQGIEDDTLDSLSELVTNADKGFPQTTYYDICLRPILWILEGNDIINNPEKQKRLHNYATIDDIAQGVMETLIRIRNKRNDINDKSLYARVFIKERAIQRKLNDSITIDIIKELIPRVMKEYNYTNVSLSNEGAWGDWWDLVKSEYKENGLGDAAMVFIGGPIIASVFGVCNILDKWNKQKKYVENGGNVKKDVNLVKEWQYLRKFYSNITNHIRANLKSDKFFFGIKRKFPNIKDYYPIYDYYVKLYKTALRIPKVNKGESIDSYKERINKIAKVVPAKPPKDAPTVSSLTLEESGFLNVSYIDKIDKLCCEIIELQDQFNKLYTSITDKLSNDDDAKAYTDIVDKSVLGVHDYYAKHLSDFENKLGQSLELITKHLSTKKDIDEDKKEDKPKKENEDDGFGDFNFDMESLSEESFLTDILNKPFWIRDPKLGKKIVHAHRGTMQDYIKEIQPGDVVLPVLSKQINDTASLKKNIGKLINTYVCGTSITSCKMVGFNKKILGYCIVPGEMVVQEIPADVTSDVWRTVVVLRYHKPIVLDKLIKIVDYMKKLSITKLPFDTKQIIKTALKNLLHIQNNTKNSKKEAIQIANSHLASYCSYAVATAFKIAGIDVGIKKQLKDIFPLDFLYSTTFDIVGVYCNPGELDELEKQVSKESLSLEAASNSSSKRSTITNYVLNILDTIDPTKTNSNRYKAFLSQMSDKDFDQWMNYIRDGKWQLNIVVPNMKLNIKMENLLKAADDVGCKLFHKFWYVDQATGKRFLTDNEYLVIEAPVRRQQQFLDEKMSVPDNDKTIDGLTGQVTGDSKSSSFSNPEIQILYSRGLHAAIQELVNVRGGNINNYAEFKRALEEGNSAKLENLNPNSRSRVSVIANVLLKSMMIDNNI